MVGGTLLNLVYDIIILTGEYIQMAGRAGRRGLDDSGTVIILCKADVPEASDLNRIILVREQFKSKRLIHTYVYIQGQPTSLESQFRLTYSMILNLMRVETLRCTMLCNFYLVLYQMRHGLILFRVEDMMKRSFAEIDSTRHINDHQEALYSIKESIESLQIEDCPICIQDINQYYSACANVKHFHKNMQVSVKINDIVT